MRIGAKVRLLAGRLSWHSSSRPPLLYTAVVKPLQCIAWRHLSKIQNNEGVQDFAVKEATERLEMHFKVLFRKSMRSCGKHRILRRAGLIYGYACLAGKATRRTQRQHHMFVVITLFRKLRLGMSHGILLFMRS